MLLAKGHEAGKCCTLDSNPDGPNSRVTDLKLNLTLATFLSLLLFSIIYYLSYPVVNTFTNIISFYL